jgi:hypothetical protein
MYSGSVRKDFPKRLLERACYIGATITHPLPPLKRGGLSGESQFVGIPVAIS